MKEEESKCLNKESFDCMKLTGNVFSSVDGEVLCKALWFFFSHLTVSIG